MIRVLIADDHPVVRYGLRHLLQAEADIEVVGEAADGDEAVELALRLNPDILLLDLLMPRVEGLEVLRRLGSSTSIRTIIITAASDHEESMHRALLLGARGTLFKDTPVGVLGKAIRSVMAGQYWVGRESAADLIDTLRSCLPKAAARAVKNKFGFTPKELEILSAVAAGCSNKEISERLSISEHTVKHHLTNVFDKAGVSNRVELALFAINHELDKG